MKTIKILLAVLFFAALSYGQGSQFPLSLVIDQFGNAIPGAAVYACQANTTEVPCLTHEVTIYPDFNLGTPLIQPVVSDGSGNYTFGCAAPSNIQIQVFAKLTQYIYNASCPSVSNGTITSVSTPSGSGLTNSIVSGVLNLSLITTCSANQILQWNGSAWVCSTNGTVTGATSGGGLLLTGATLGLITSCSPNQVLSWNGAAWVCASTGSGTLTGASANGGLLVAGTTIGLITTCSNSQVLAWTSGSSSWGCANAGAGTVTGATASGGLVATGTTLGLLKTCSDTQVLAWSAGGSSWGCAANGTSIPLGTAAQIPVMNAGATAYAAVSLSQDCTVTATGVLTCLKTNNVAFGTFATQNFATPPVLGGSTPNIVNASTLLLPAPGIQVWNSDTGLSRTGSDSLACGNGTANDASCALGVGSLAAATNVQIGAGTAVPCGGDCIGLVETSTAGTPTGGADYFRPDSTAHGFKLSLNGGAEFVSAMNIPAPATIVASAPVVQLIVGGTTALGTGTISGGTCSAVSTTATGTLTTDAIDWAPNVDLSAVTGYSPSGSGALTIYPPWPTADHVNFTVCNNTSSSIPRSALTVNWKVRR